jgi:hypothetical protein
VNADATQYLEHRFGRLHVRQRLGVERDHEAQVFGYGRTFFHPENSQLMASLIAWTLKASGLYWRGRRNAARVALVETRLRLKNLPAAFAGFTVLQLSDLHADLSREAMRRVTGLLAGLPCDVCVLTGDYRGATHGSLAESMALTAELLGGISAPKYGILGNHDSLLMVPELEAMGVHMLLNEAVVIGRGGQQIHLAGVDDPHFYRAENLEKAATGIPPDAFSILLAHSPEIYRQATHAGFDLMLCGHTHGGQVCLPGGRAITFFAAMPRRLGAGHWQHHDMTGYTSRGAGTSLVPVRFNCPPEITLHRLERAA